MADENNITSNDKLGDEFDKLSPEDQRTAYITLRKTKKILMWASGGLALGLVIVSVIAFSK